MVHSHQAVLLIGPLVHGEVNHPQALELVLVTKAQLIGHLKTQFRELLAGLHGVITAQNEDKVTWLSVHGSLKLLQNLLRIELIDR